MRATAASFLLGGVAVAAHPARRFRTSPRRLAPPARNAPRATAAADHIAEPSTPRSVLFVSFLWPEASSSAAGVRTRSLLEAFKAWGWQVHYLACARANEHTESLERSGVTTHRVSPNRGADFEDALDRASPDAVVFDRFTAEEAFSFRVRAARPTAARILDMQDLHALRRARHDAVKRALLGGAANDGGAESESVLRASLAAVPAAGDPSVARELAAVHRCDLTLVCSPVEMRLMRDRFGIPASKLAPASFFCERSSSRAGTDLLDRDGFVSREGFTTIGTFHHLPNVDAVRWLATEVWPLIREALPDATMRVYGAYPTEAVKQLHKPGAGFLVLGFAESVEAAMEESRVLLAPLRFGAGIKGKIVDAWMHGLPVVTTPIGAEGMRPGEDALWSDCSARRIKDEEEDWGGRWRSLDAASFARDAVALHEDAGAWERARARGSGLIDELFAGEKNLAAVRDATEALFVEAEAEFENVREGGETESFSTTLEARRARDYVGGALWHHTLRSTEYFSRWIEMKETGTESGTELSVSDRE